jgi:hypothetical protein
MDDDDEWWLDWCRRRQHGKVSRRIARRIRNDVVCVRRALRPAVLIDALRLSASVQQSLLLSLTPHAHRDALVVLSACGGDAVLLAHRDALLACVRDDALFRGMRTVDVDSFRIAALADGVPLLAEIRAHLAAVLPAAAHGDVLALPDWNLYPPTLVGLLLLYPVVFARSDADWHRESALADHPLRLVRVQVEHDSLVHAPSPGELLQLSRRGASGANERGCTLWSFSIPATLAVSDDEWAAHFRQLIDREQVSDDCVHVSQSDVSDECALTL